MADSSFSSNVYRIDPLKGAKNHLVWKIKMTDILTDLGLLEYANGTHKAPTVMDRTTSMDWKAKDQKALSTVCLRVGDGLLVYIVGGKSSNKAWAMLQAMCKARGLISILTVHWKLFRVQCEDGGNIEEHICMLWGLMEELASLGSKIIGEDFLITLLTSLPDSWDPFISAVDSASLKESHKLIVCILEEDHHIQVHNGSDMALAARKHNPNITCYNCNEKGHITLHCTKPKKGNGGSGGGNSSGKRRGRKRNSP